MSTLLERASHAALLYVYVAYTVVHGLHAESSTIVNVIVPVGLHVFEVF